MSRWHTLLGLQDGAFDRKLRLHRRRFLDRAALTMAFFGVCFLIVAFFGGDVGKLQTSDWISVGSIFVTGAGLFLSLGDSR